MEVAQRVIAIGLDGYEKKIADELISDGRLPTFKRLAMEAAEFSLDHGDARETGLAWEHFSTGKHPDGYHRWSALEFDPSTYTLSQPTTRTEPFLAEIDLPVLAFDVPYLDLSRTRSTFGMSNWGAHDPGIERHSVPGSLDSEIFERFGDYPGKKYIYGFVWPSPEDTEDMADRMIEATRRRAEVFRWLARERLPDWRVATTVIAELHSSLEAFWHGWDCDHPYHNLPSAGPARRGIEGVYEETDKLIAGLIEDHPDAAFVIFSMHGMGPNKADISSMVLLPELMYRRAFNRPFLHPRDEWMNSVPVLEPGEPWSTAINGRQGRHGPLEVANLPTIARALRKFERIVDRVRPSKVPISISWMPAAHYAPFWPQMDAFALPAYYDGQVRINLEGRESNGTVPLSRYKAVLDDVEEFMDKARDPSTGEPVVAQMNRPLEHDPFTDSQTRCDLKILWRSNTFSIEAPGVGVAGPVPQRRTGGHTGDHGYAAIFGPGVSCVNSIVASSFDVVPTILKLAGADIPDGLSGDSLVV